MRPRRILAALATTSVLLTVAAVVVAMNREYLPGMQWPEPPIITPGADGSPPSDAIVLFDGKDLSAWEPSDTWKVGDGFFTEGRGDIHTKQNFGDIQLHIEWSSPNPPRGHDQDRGNSGVFFQDRYELQVLDSYDNTTYYEGQAGAIYKQTPPMVNAMRPPGEWNVYDVVCVDGVVKLSVNGKFVNGVAKASQKKGYLCLESEGAEIHFRNIRILELPPGITSEEQTAPVVD